MARLKDLAPEGGGQMADGQQGADSNPTRRKMMEGMRNMGMGGGLRGGLMGGLFGPGGPFGVQIFETPLMVEREEYEETVELTFRQRWVEPVLHPVTLPFEPWVKTRTETRVRMVPSRQVIKTERGLFMHPAMRAEVTRQLGGI